MKIWPPQGGDVCIILPDETQQHYFSFQCCFYVSMCVCMVVCILLQQSWLHTVHRSFPWACFSLLSERQYQAVEEVAEVGLNTRDFILYNSHPKTFECPHNVSHRDKQKKCSIVYIITFYSTRINQYVCRSRFSSTLIKCSWTTVNAFSVVLYIQ